jgi:hypothetical protein
VTSLCNVSHEVQLVRKIYAHFTLSMMVVCDQYIWGQLMASTMPASISVGILYLLDSVSSYRAWRLAL